jgi:hypothetical protein
MFMVGGGAGMGVFLKPRAANRYARDWAQSLGGFVIVAEDGSEKFLFHYIPQFSLDFAPFSWLRLQSSSELALGGATVRVYGDREGSRTFLFSRMSEVVVANLEVPVNAAGTMHAFVGAGAGIHYLTLDRHTAFVPGFRAQLGFAVLEQQVRVDGLVTFDHVRGNSKRDQTWQDGRTTPLELDYTSIHLNAVLHYNVFP